jgi:hypothetical protein
MQPMHWQSYCEVYCAAVVRLSESAAKSLKVPLIGKTRGNISIRRFNRPCYYGDITGGIILFVRPIPTGRRVQCSDGGTAELEAPDGILRPRRVSSGTPFCLITVLSAGKLSDFEEAAATVMKLAVVRAVTVFPDCRRFLTCLAALSGLILTVQEEKDVLCLTGSGLI